MNVFVVDEIEEPKPTARQCRPCELKGSYLGRTDCGWRLNNDRHKSLTCELLDRRLCNREFEQDTSLGVLNHLKQNPLSKFQGCQKLDQTLFEAKELSLEPNTFEVISDDPLAMSRSRDDGFDSLDIPDESDDLFFGRSGASNWLKWIEDLDKKRSQSQNLVHDLKAASGTPLSNFLSPAPESLEHIHFKNLVSKGYFKRVKAASESEREVITFVADLLVRGYWDLEVIKQAFPGIDIPNFEEVKRKVCLHLAKTLPEKAKRFNKFWEIDLTQNQREALWLYYMKNPYKRSQEFVASKIGISVESFKDRLAGAIAKLKSAFPELLEPKEPTPPKPVAEVMPPKVLNREEIATFSQSWKPIPDKRGRLHDKFDSLDAYYAWEQKTTFYPNTSGTW